MNSEFKNEFSKAKSLKMETSEYSETMTKKVKLLSVDGKCIEMNKSDFEKNSDYFRCLVNSGMMDSTKSELNLKSLTGDSLLEVQKYFQWLNGGDECFPKRRPCLIKVPKFVNDSQNILVRIEVGLGAALYLQIEEMISIYTKKLSKSISILNWYLVSTITDKYCLESIEKKLIDLIIQNFDKVTETKQFQLLPSRYMKQILSADKLCVKSEFYLFENLLRWLVNHQDCQWMLRLIRLIYINIYK